MNPLLEQFLAEAREALEGIARALMDLEASPDDHELMTHLFRLVHTLKGNSGLFEFPEMTRVLHAGEDLMDAVRNGRAPFTQDVADALLLTMDFVGEQCDDIEAGRPVDPGLATEAAGLAQRVRALIPSAAGAAEPAPAGPGAVAAGGALDPAWLDRVPADVLALAREHLDQGVAVHWVRYAPVEDCFFQGVDPLYQARQTPGLLWGGIAPRAAWPALAEMDAYRCQLDFDMLAEATEAELLAHFRYEADQVRLYPLAPSAQAAVVATPVQAPAPAPAAAPASDLSAAQALVRALVDAQRRALERLQPGKSARGALAGVGNALAGCLKADGRVDLQEELDLALQAAQEQRSGQPLLVWTRTTWPPLADVVADTVVPPAPAPAPETEAAAPAPAETGDHPETEGRSARRADDAVGAKVLRVEQTKIDRLMGLIGEMVVAKNAIPYLANRAETVFGVRELSREIKAQYAVINRISEEMQDAIMQVRMMPVSFVFQRFPRLVRDTSRRLGKDVRLTMEGQDTAADKNVIESLGDPLLHIVRNSLDHGLESPEARLAAGKPAQGHLSIVARQEADRVIIEISDDGRGIDPVVVKRKAYEKGLIDEQQLDRLSDQEAVNLVFAAGFSTAEAVSDLSGRGVGMDVVRTTVERVNGSIELHSVKGQGTVIRLSLPLSMAVTQVMTVESDGQMFGVPMDAVVETVRVPASAVRQFKQHMVTTLRGRVVPLRGLNQVLGLASPPLCNDHDEYAVLVVRVGHETLGVLVDEFHETADIILKPLAGVLGGLRSYSGSALMGDGSVLMVLNVKEML